MREAARGRVGVLGVVFGVLGVVFGVVGVVFGVVGVAATTRDATTTESAWRASWRTGETTDSLLEYNAHARRLVGDAAPIEAWEGAERFLASLDGSLADASVNGCVLHEFNSLPNVESVDVSVRLEYYAMAKTGMLERLGVTCDPRSGRDGGKAWCLGLERSTAFERHRKWWRRLSERYEDGRHPYWLGEYLEFDMDVNEVNPTASVFIEHTPQEDGRHAEYVPALREYLEAIGETASERLYENVQAVIDAAKGEGFSTHMWAAGIMFSRSEKAASGTIDGVRVLIRILQHVPQKVAREDEDGYRSGKMRQIVRLLKMLKWSGDFSELDRIHNYLPQDGWVGCVLHVDVLDRVAKESDSSIIGPRVGVEVPISDPSQNVMPQLSGLVDDGLVDATWWRNFTSALCEPDDSVARLPTDQMCAVRQCAVMDNGDLTKIDGIVVCPTITVAVSHFKFIVQPERSLYVKPYISTRRPYRYCLDGDAFSKDHSLPTYHYCDGETFY